MDQHANQAILGLLTHFWASENFPKKIGYGSFEYLGPQFHAKYKKKLMSQSWEKCSDKKST